MVGPACPLKQCSSVLAAQQLLAPWCWGSDECWWAVVWQLMAPPAWSAAEKQSQAIAHRCWQPAVGPLLHSASLEEALAVAVILHIFCHIAYRVLQGKEFKRLISCLKWHINSLLKMSPTHLTERDWSSVQQMEVRAVEEGLRCALLCLIFLPCNQLGEKKTKTKNYFLGQ